MKCIPCATQKMTYELWIKVATQGSKLKEYYNIRDRYLDMGKTSFSLEEQVLRMPLQKTQMIFRELKQIYEPV